MNDDYLTAPNGKRLWFRLFALRAMLIAFVLGLGFGACFERYAHSCAPYWSVSGLIGAVIDDRCVESGTSRP